ncbi:serine/threonine-protein kinase Sgk2-like [Corticium candelabrum]|uniref:serine/threonine-protein kinase Sgk2-like n=1 Tax=Corticium candelabrum TaxID=121492 RepID=UPI002E2635F4|nr:serine/threonine-protein kinase Sgk2-like [Corticium candelabrum]
MDRLYCCCWSRKASKHETNALLDGAEGGDYRPPLVTPQVPTVKHFKLLSTIGKGAFGKVFQVKDKRNGEVYALKVVSKAAIKTNKDEARILAEAHILRRISHPFCVSLKFTFQSAEHLFYVFEFIGGGMLFFHLRKERCFDEPRARFYIGETILALEYLHSLGIIFRDLKPENCLLYPDGHICLTDFGAAKDLGDSGEQTATFCGTPNYIAPEILRAEHYGLAVDWWTCGILLYEMLVGKPPFIAQDRVILYKQVLRGVIDYPDNLSEHAVSLISQLLQRDPDKRLGCSSFQRGETAASIKEQSFFSCHFQTKSDGDDKTCGSHLQTKAEGNDETPTCSHIHWTWEQLERRKVRPPFVPILISNRDLRYVDRDILDDKCSFDNLPGRRKGETKLCYLEDFDYATPLPQ